MDKAKFYQSIRSAGTQLFGVSLKQSQVDGMEVIINEAISRNVPLKHLAYMLATAFHETANTMLPITEYGQRSYFNRYEPGTKVGKDLGNVNVGDGYLFRGRGYVQLTGRSNYRRATEKLGADFVKSPELALNPRHATEIMFTGMAEGWFTGKKLADYINGSGTDYINARRIINGTDRASMIAGYAVRFENALVAGGYGKTAPAPVQAQKPVTAPATPVAAPAQGGGIVAAIIAIIAAIFGAKK